jgi:hypothetical protein
MFTQKARFFCIGGMFLGFFYICVCVWGGGHTATSRKVAGSIPVEVIGVFKGVEEMNETQS